MDENIKKILEELKRSQEDPDAPVFDIKNVDLNPDNQYG